MHTEPTHDGVRPHKNRHLAERFEGIVGIVMVVAIVLLAIGLVWGILQTGEVEPRWMQ